MSDTARAGYAPTPKRGNPHALRFAMITTFYPPYSFGGDAIAIRRLSEALVRRGHDVTVVHDVDAYNALHDGPEPAPGRALGGPTVVPLRSGLGVLSPLLTQQTGRPIVHGGRIRRLLNDEAFDIVHFNNVSLVGGPGVLSAGGGVKVYEAHEHWLVCPTHVLWRHGREVCTGRECLRCVLHHRRPPQLWRYTGYLDRQLREIDLLIAKSEFSRRKHHEFGLDRPMDVLPYFLPDLEGGEAGRTGGDPHRAHDRPYFLFVGRLERIKGLDDLIPVFGDYADADLLIAGDGTDGTRLRRSAEGHPRVRFLGPVSPEALEAYYRDALALIVPSICFETFGIILIEAFRQRTPVIARRIGPFPEIVEACGGGELFESRGELVEAMRRIQRDPAHRERLARSAIRGFRERWSESAVVPRYLGLVGEAAERSGRGDIARAIESAA
ncbi:MAG: glycosyltransferase family 4 protein [Gemmatimonadota bacterium]